MHEQKSNTCYILHVQYSWPLVKNFFGVYSTTEEIVEALCKFKGLDEIPSAPQIKAQFAASDVYHKEQLHMSIWIGEAPAQMIEYACGKLQRIQDKLMGP